MPPSARTTPLDLPDGLRCLWDLGSARLETWGPPVIGLADNTGQPALFNTPQPAHVWLLLRCEWFGDRALNGRHSKPVVACESIPPTRHTRSRLATGGRVNPTNSHPWRGGLHRQALWPAFTSRHQSRRAPPHNYGRHANPRVDRDPVSPLHPVVACRLPLKGACGYKRSRPHTRTGVLHCTVSGQGHSHTGVSSANGSAPDKDTAPSSFALGGRGPDGSLTPCNSEGDHHT